MNAIGVIAPYKYEGICVFDDPAGGLSREPLVVGGALAEAAMSRLKARLANQTPLPETKGEARTTFPSVNRTNGSKTTLT